MKTTSANSSSTSTHLDLTDLQNSSAQVQMHIQLDKLFDQNKNSDESSDDESDISNESIAEKKILKIDHKLKKNKSMDKAQKRKLQNRKSALKCRLRKSHMITTLSQEVAALKQERSTLADEVAQLKDLLKEEKLKNSQHQVEIAKLQNLQMNPMMYAPSVQRAPMQMQSQPFNQYYVQGVVPPQQNYYHVPYKMQAQPQYPMYSQYTH